MGVLKRVTKWVDDYVPTVGKLARTGWVEASTARLKRSGFQPAIPPGGDKLIADMRRSGTSVVERYLDGPRCAALRGEIDRLLEHHKDAVWTDAVDSDHRLYGADRVSEPIAALCNDAFIRSTLHAYERSDDVRGFALAARMDAKPNNPGSGVGWHRDDALLSQAKAIYYLSDVGPQQGPFEYLPGSHRPERIVVDMLRAGAEHGQMRFPDDTIAALESGWPGYKRQVATAPEGSVLLADTRGLHRGSPIVAGSRYAVTVYLWFDAEVPEHMAKLMVDA